MEEIPLILGDHGNRDYAIFNSRGKILHYQDWYIS